ncbi:MAG: UbiD family decarboxylase [Deltaproteobacteria bacterium]|nr:UbiD family decarboxylase [Deltaproteobacteria bacterium]
MFRDLREYLTELDRKGELVRIKEDLSPRYEIAATIREVGRTRGSAVLFERVRGFTVPVVGNLLRKRSYLAWAFGLDEAHIVAEYVRRRKRPIPPRIVRNGPVKEVVRTEKVDLLRTLPILTHYQRDAGPYLTCAMTVARDPETGMRGMGIHRLQVKGPDKLGIYLASPPVATFLAKAEKRKRPLEVAIFGGVDPLTFVGSVVWAPSGIDKFAIAGGLLQAPVDLVKCETVDLEVPAWAEYVLEGVIPPGRRELEGPFGESTGYYMACRNPVVQLRAITTRRDPVYHGLLAFSGEEEVLSDICREADELQAVRQAFPWVLRLRYLSRGQVIVVQVKKRADREAARLLRHLLGMNKVVKIAILVDPDVDVNDFNEIAWALATRFQPDRDMLVRKNLDGWGIDPSARNGKTSKLGIDATKPVRELRRFERVDFPPQVLRRVREILGML